MAEKYTEAQKKASLKYQADKAQIKITVSPEQRDKYQALAQKRDTSLTKLMTELLDKEAKKMTIKDYNNNWDIYYGEPDAYGSQKRYSFDASGDNINEELYDSCDEVAEFIAEELDERGYKVTEEEMQDLRILVKDHFPWLDKADDGSAPVWYYIKTNAYDMIAKKTGTGEVRYLTETSDFPKDADGIEAFMAAVIKEDFSLEWDRLSVKGLEKIIEQSEVLFEKEILPGVETEDGLRRMLKLNTNMTDREIDRHIKDGYMVYNSFEEAVNALTDAGESREEAEEDVNRHYEKMEYNGHTYYVDFTL